MLATQNSLSCAWALPQEVCHWFCIQNILSSRIALGSFWGSCQWMLTVYLTYMAAAVTGTVTGTAIPVVIWNLGTHDFKYDFIHEFISEFIGHEMLHVNSQSWNLLWIHNTIWIYDHEECCEIISCQNSHAWIHLWIHILNAWLWNHIWIHNYEFMREFSAMKNIMLPSLLLSVALCQHSQKQNASYHWGSKRSSILKKNPLSWEKYSHMEQKTWLKCMIVTDKPEFNCFEYKFWKCPFFLS